MSPASGLPTRTPALAPLPGERGLASYDPVFLAERVEVAWASVLALAEHVDLAAPSRLPGWTGRDVLVHLGSWPEAPLLDGLLADARSGLPSPRHTDRGEQDAANAAALARHADATPEEVAAALRAARDATLGFLRGEEAETLGERAVGSALGPLPLLSVVAGSTYELAVHALDLAPCGAPPPAPELLHTALGALVDVTAALATRTGIATTPMAAAVDTPGGGWAFAARGGDWTVVECEPGAAPPGPTVEAPAAVLLDVSAGRVAVPPLLVSRRLRVHAVAGVLTLAPLVEAVPGLPGGASLRLAARTLRGVGRLLHALPHR